MNYISFPGLGIDYFGINPTAFTIFGKEIRWYGIIICIGIILGFSVLLKNAKFNKISTDDVLDMVIIIIPSAIIGARLYYVLTSLSDYDSFYEMIAIWHGGLAIYGAIIFGAIAAFFVCRHKKIGYLTMLDCLAPGVLLGQIIGRWGNFTNAEAYGSIEQYDILGHTFNTPNLANDFPLRMLIKDSVDASYSLVTHPTFLYESVWNLIGFVFLFFYFKKRKFKGEILLMYLTWYGFGRFFIEGFRTDSLWVGSFRVSQLLSAVLFIAGLALLIVLRMRSKKQDIEYTPIFDNAEKGKEGDKQ